MTTAIKRRRGTTTQHSTFTGLEGEITIDTTKDTAVVHDGATAGGRPLLREDLANNTEVVTKTGTQTLTNKTLTSPVINTPTGITKSDISLGNVDNTSDATKNAATATLTNKTITLGTNTITGTVAQFQAAVTDGDFATLAGTETFTNKAFNGSLGATTPSTAVVTSLTSSALTSGRVTFASTGGLLADSANLTFDGTNINVVGTVNSGTLNFPSASSAPASGYGLRLKTGVGTEVVSAYQIGFSVNGGTSVAALFDSSGNLGLGVTPSAWQSTSYKVVQLGYGTSLLGQTDAAQTILGTNYYLNSSYQYTYINSTYATRYNQVSGQHQWFTAPSGTAGNAITFTQAMTLDASGNLGVGTTSSLDKLTVAGALKSTASLTVGSISASSTYIDNTSGIARMLSYGANSSTRGSFSFFQATSTNTSGQEAVGIDANGRFTLASASGGNLAGRISCGNQSGMTNTPHNAGIWAYAASTDAYPMGATGQSTNQGLIGFFDSAGTIIGNVFKNGSLVAYNTSSDYRLKENIAPMVNALATVQALKPVTYNWKADGSDGQGFIAHELAEVIPDCVTGEKDATREEEYEISPAIPAVLDEEGNEVTPAVEAVMGTRTVPSYQGIDTSFLVATLTAAIQEQQAMIDELKAKVAALEAA